MELLVSLALGAWISYAGWLAYKNLKKEYEDKGGSEK